VERDAPHRPTTAAVDINRRIPERAGTADLVYR
jgi:hypothetical protein